MALVKIASSGNRFLSPSPIDRVKSDSPQTAAAEGRVKKWIEKKFKSPTLLVVKSSHHSFRCAKLNKKTRVENTKGFCLAALLHNCDKSAIEYCVKCKRRHTARHRLHNSLFSLIKGELYEVKISLIEFPTKANIWNRILFRSIHSRMKALGKSIKPYGEPDRKCVKCVGWFWLPYWVAVVYAMIRVPDSLCTSQWSALWGCWKNICLLHFLNPTGKVKCFSSQQQLSQFIARSRKTKLCNSCWNWALSSSTFLRSFHALE